MILNQIKNFFFAIYKLKKAREYEADSLSEEDFYKISRGKKKFADEQSGIRSFFRIGYVYTYEKKGTRIFVSPMNHSGGYDSSAILQIITNDQRKYTLKVTYYKPTLLNNAAIFGACILFVAFLFDPEFWMGIVISFSILVAFFFINYIIFETEWNRVESEILKTFNLVKPQKSNLRKTNYGLQDKM